MQNYPNWSPDGKWIVYMNDTDDGHVVVGSEIKATNIEAQKTF